MTASRGRKPHDSAPQALSTDKPADVLEIRNLIDRVGMINRIHTALRFTLNVEDIHSIILTTLISRQGLDLSRAFLLGYNETRGLFQGFAALGAANRADHDRLHHEIDEEEACLASMVRDLTNSTTPKEEETLFNRSLRELSNHSFWITTYQKYSPHNPLGDAIQQIELPCSLEALEKLDTNLGRFLNDICTSETSQIIPHEVLPELGLPPALIDLLPQDSLWITIRTQKGVRLILVADKAYGPGPLSEVDRLHVDWFVGQVALALENAEMFKDLEQAYNSLRDLDRMKSNFLATISHELRTPLTAINGYVQLMLGHKIGLITPGQQEVLERIHAHSDMLTGKVNDLIEIAEMDSGRSIEVVLAPVDPLNVIMTVLPRVEARRAHKGITIEPLVTSPIPLIRANRDALERIFFHLIDNAIKFGLPQGHVWIEFETFGSELHISVVDDGIGISQGQLRNIFDTFYQIDNQLTRSYAGLGIGLAVIKRQIDSTAGKIHVQSQPGHGSTFTIIYPIVATDASSAIKF